MVGPAEEFLGIGIDELREKDPVKRGVLADKNSFFSADAPFGK